MIYGRITTEIEPFKENGNGVSSLPAKEKETAEWIRIIKKIESNVVEHLSKMPPFYFYILYAVTFLELGILLLFKDSQAYGSLASRPLFDHS